MSDPPRDTCDTTTCPRCNGTGEIERPTCSLVDCNRKMISLGDGAWQCPVHPMIIL